MFARMVSLFLHLNLSMPGRCKLHNSWLFKKQYKEWILKGHLLARCSVFRIKSQVETIYNLYSLMFVAYIMSNNVKFKLLHKVLECVVKGP